MRVCKCVCTGHCHKARDKQRSHKMNMQNQRIKNIKLKKITAENSTEPSEGGDEAGGM